MEIVAVLFLAALLGAVVVMSLKGVGRDTLVENAIDRWKAYDAATRTQARQFGVPLRLRVSLDDSRVARSAVVGERTGGTDLELPRGKEGVRIDRIMTPADSAIVGDYELLFSERGYSPSYAVLLAGPGGRREWLLFAGMTGETRTVRDENDVVEILRLAATPAGNDAD